MGRRVGGVEASELRRRAKQQGCREQSGEIPAQRIGADNHSPIWDACLLTCWGGWGLGAEAGASEIRSQGEDWGWLCEDSLKWASAPQLAGKESGKKSGPARETRGHCFRVCEERGFLPCVPTESRALPKQAPEKGVSCGYQLGLQRWAWNANAAITATKNPVCKHRSLPTSPPGSLCSIPLPGSQDPWTTSPGKHSTHLNLLQCHASLCHWRLKLHCNYDYLTPPSPQPEWTREPKSASASTPSRLGRKQTPEGNLHAEAVPKPKLNPRSCADKEEKTKFLCAASGAVD